MLIVIQYTDYYYIGKMKIEKSTIRGNEMHEKLINPHRIGNVCVCAFVCSICDAINSADVTVTVATSVFYSYFFNVCILFLNLIYLRS